METTQIIQELIKIGQIERIITIGTFFATIATIAGGIVTTIWFIRDTRKENSKILKSILDVQMRIEEGQRKGFAALEEGQRKGFTTLEEGQKAIAEMLSNQTKILEKILGKLP